ncbi:hypothetical protein BV898_11145 [Hypsibius exemplaris]|uniref:Sushi domain-containing protein n=1 Tax=Hypsibius exemplaris TaxID=2072580 RepID=A0A1W0WHH6_HYPEX|nr:hypothetical protein BV898_11145 [Hypsibius exemplaris]
MSFPGICLVLLALMSGCRGQPAPRGRMDIPMGVPDLNDRFSNGLANYIGMSALPGANSQQGNFGMGGRFGAEERSGAGPAAPGNSVGGGGGFYDTPFSMPQVQSNTAGMTNWYGPEFAPPQQQRQQQQQGNGQTSSDGSIIMENLSCSRDFLHTAIGLSNNRSNWLSTVECECRLVRGRQPGFSCYSLCDGPQRGLRCEPYFPVNKTCPSYKNCGNWTQSTSTDSGAISCKTGVPVPESVCWILASATLRADDTPLRPAFYANAAAGCFMSCLCGNDGTVAGEIRCLDNPTTNWRFPVYPRSKKHEFGK